MSENPPSDRSKTLFIFGAVVLVLLLITYLAFHRERGVSEHRLPQITAANFDSEVLKADMPVLVDFYAEWCGPCRQMEPILLDFARENPGIKVVQVNVDDNPELSDRFRIDSIPNLLVFKKGEKTAQQLGLTGKEALKAMIDR
jgi:thioredoxin 1